MKNILRFSPHAINKDSTTHGTPADGSAGFNFYGNSDRYLIIIQPLLGSTVKTKIWFYYDITSDAKDQLSLSEDYVISNQGDLLGDIEGTDWTSFTIENTGAKGVYVEIVSGTANILISNNELDIQ
jgi:hypothetical protein